VLRTGGQVTILEETLLTQFGVKVGDAVRLGQATFTIVGAIKKVPGAGFRDFDVRSAASCADGQRLEATGLEKRESISQHRLIAEVAGGTAIPRWSRSACGVIFRQRLQYPTGGRAETESRRGAHQYRRLSQSRGLYRAVSRCDRGASAVHENLRGRQKNS